jgi:alkaline phosphatase D
MKKLMSAIFFATLYFVVVAQDYKSAQRLSFEPALEPFYHGVASGDPLSDRVIIWTRITSQTTGTLNATWVMATDTGLTNVVQSGNTTTNDAKDYTIKVDVAGLQPSTYYYYQFEHDGKKSLIGRTKTAPTGDNDFLRFAVVSCNDYQNGYFNAFKHISERNDIDAVLHLGDYIYEYAATSSPGAPGRTHEPTNEIITLSDYRGRYSHYRLDPDLRAAHQQHPFVTVWDDHETANNAWEGGAENHTPGTEGNWTDRKNAGVQANLEWLPIRQPDVNEPVKIWRKIRYGDLAEIFFLDTRLYGRSEQGGNPEDPNRTLLGTDQFSWLKSELSASTSQWKVLAQQVMVAPLKLPAVLGGGILNNDQWDGYNYERQQLYNHVRNNNIENMVVLTGDIHTSWANDLPDSNYNGTTGANSAGVEFVATSITSGNSEANVPNSLVSLFQAANPHIKYFNLTEHGYFILDLSKAKAQADWNFVSTIESQTYTSSVAASWYANNQERFLREATAPANSNVNPNNAPLAPTSNLAVGIAKAKDNVVVVGTFPNPFQNEFVVQFYVEESKKTSLKVIDVLGKTVLTETYVPNKGINYVKVNAEKLLQGNYILLMETGKDTYRKNIVKVN